MMGSSILPMTADYKLTCGHMLQREMAAFDSLPKEIREAVSASPFGTCAVEVKGNIECWGEYNWLAELRRAEKQLRKNTGETD